MSDDTQKDIDEYSGVETTGHEWDGIKELNNPLPRWWLWIFYATIAFSVVYWVLMPAFPAPPGMGGTNTPGLRGHSDRALVAMELDELRTMRADTAGRLMATDLEAILDDPDLLQFALAAGESAFGDNCATCHGAGGRGAPGYPVLADDTWLWDGSLQGIEYTLENGIRDMDNAETRFSLMPAFGRDGLLSDDQIEDLTQYVLNLAGEEADMAAVNRASELYQQQCALCHGQEGLGDPNQGAPNLTDAVWLYGSDADAIYQTIYSARNSQMPAWEGRLDDPTIRALAVYVHSLGGGE